MKFGSRIGFAATALLAACSMNGRMAEPSSAVPLASPATADVRQVTGKSIARATASQIGDSVRIRVEAEGLRAGTYGAHVHAVGRCDAPDFGTAGPHWNPTSQQHGKNNPQGMHKGDLPNLFVGADGRGAFEINVPGAWLTGGEAPMLDGDGAAVVVHERADDYRTDPSGNSGGRIACGVLRPTGG